MGKSQKKYTRKPQVCVYVIVNIVNGRVYIGGTHYFPGRKATHKSHLKHNQHGNPILQADYNKYGIEAFEFEILEKCPPRELRFREMQYLKKYQNTGFDCYNVQESYNCIKLYHEDHGWVEEQCSLYEFIEKYNLAPSDKTELGAILTTSTRVAWKGWMNREEPIKRKVEWNNEKIMLYHDQHGWCHIDGLYNFMKQFGYTDKNYRRRRIQFVKLLHGKFKNYYGWRTTENNMARKYVEQV